MIDPKLLQADLAAVRASEVARQNDPSIIDLALEKEAEYKKTLQDFENNRARQKQYSKKITSCGNHQEKETLLEEVGRIAQEVKQITAKLQTLKGEYFSAIGKIDNLILSGVPHGGEENSEVVRICGKIPEFGFDPKPHFEIMTNLGMLDIERGVKVSGSRFYFLRNMGARLELALMQLGLDLALEHGFEMITPPTLVRAEIMNGTGFMTEHQEEVYFLPSYDLYLTGTSEVALAGLHKDEIIDLDVPKKYVGWSTCYRSEAGAAGRDTKGIMRVHQFNKLEMFVYCAQDDAKKMHLELLKLQEHMLRALELPYRVLNIAAGDLGTSAAQKYDLEAWIPSLLEYRELTSTSNCTTYQARRLNIRTKDTGKGKDKGKDKESQIAATLNGTLATTRWLIAIVENFQNADGSVSVPRVLQPYLKGQEVIG